MAEFWMRNWIWPFTTVIPEGPEAPGPLLGPLLIDGRSPTTVVTWPLGVTLATAPDGLAHAGSTPVLQPAGTVFVPASVTSRSPFGPTVILRGWLRPVATTWILAGNVWGEADRAWRAPADRLTWPNSPEPALAFGAAVAAVAMVGMTSAEAPTTP